MSADAHLSGAPWLPIRRELPAPAVPWQAEQAPDPQLVVLNEPLATEPGFEPAFLCHAVGLRLLIGTALPGEATAVAQGYVGHQFGFYLPRLGDGWVLLPGELADVEGRPRDIHLKAPGPGGTS